MKRSSKPRNPPSRSDDDGKSSLANKIRILIADDHTTVLAGLASIIGMQAGHARLSPKRRMAARQLTCGGSIALT